ncbi:MAG TPA: DUF481 domain-containing protein [Candidatus Polarisedimenticolia bacterium]|nr:DUF481 domain-containing protein [Candidatus Polarisedimenticolia bacterium]
MRHSFLVRHSLLLPAILVALATGRAHAAEAPKEEKPPGPWSNSTEISLVATEGNTTSGALGLKDTFEYKVESGRSRFRIDALQSVKSDDPFLLVEPGITFLPGETPTGVPSREVRPGSEPDVERWFVEGRYDGNLKNKATWNSGASWDMNEDAGIVSRYIVFAGLGNVWVDREDRSFRTSYGISFTDRKEEIDDPEKERRFPGVRLSTDFKDTWGPTTTYDCDFTFNISVKDFSDYNVSLDQGVAVPMSRHLSLKVGLQFLYASEPALEEVDVIARVRIVDPDGIPGSGDEFFETVESGGAEITVGEDSLRKKELDTTFRTSLMISF